MTYPYPLQHYYREDLWKMLCCCILLNQSTGDSVRKYFEEFFRRYTDPETLLRMNVEEMKELIRPSGLYNVKTDRLLKMSIDFLNSKNILLSILMGKIRGVGEYAIDSVLVFYLDTYNFDPKDEIVKTYVQWKREEIEKPAHWIE